MPKNIQTGSLLLAFQQEAETLLRVTSSIMIIFEIETSLFDELAQLTKQGFGRITQEEYS